MAESKTGLVVVLSTLENEVDAQQLARTLVEERLIACGNIFPGLTSVYRWEGKIEEAGEVLLLMKEEGFSYAEIAEIMGSPIGTVMAAPVSTTVTRQSSPCDPCRVVVPSPRSNVIAWCRRR